MLFDASMAPPMRAITSDVRLSANPHSPVATENSRKPPT
jgi:hypothetical protein